MPKLRAVVAAVAIAAALAGCGGAPVMGGDAVTIPSYTVGKMKTDNKAYTNLAGIRRRDGKFWIIRDYPVAKEPFYPDDQNVTITKTDTGYVVQLGQATLDDVQAAPGYINAEWVQVTIS